MTEHGGPGNNRVSPTKVVFLVQEGAFQILPSFHEFDM